MVETDQSLTGMLLADRYRVGEILGRGGMGIVYAGEHVRVGRKVAIKILPPEWSSVEATRRRFEAEARAASAAGHPNVIQILDIDMLDDGRLYTVMEYVEGRDLGTLLAEEGPLTIERACRLIRDVGFGVHAAHAQGVVHRDLKLPNVMVSQLAEGEVVKVLDFGIASQPHGGERLTVAGLVMGTPEYMAPEQASGAEPTPAFDIYALGVMLFELLTLQLPLDDENRLRLLARKTMETSPRVSTLRQDVPEGLDQLIADCLAIDPSQRPVSAAAFSQQLSILIDGGLSSVPVPRLVGPASTGPTMFDTSTGDPSDAGTVTSISPVVSPAEPAAASPPAAEDGAPVLPTAALKETPPPTSATGSGPVVSMVAIAAICVLVGGLWFFMRGEGAASEGASANATSAGDRAPADPQPPPEAPPEAPPSQPLAAEPASEDGPEVVAVVTTGKPQADVSAEVEDERADEDESGSEDEGEGEDSPTVAAKASPSTTARCERVRESATDGRSAHDWLKVLDATRSRECWGRARDRKKLETQAYMELGRFSDCLRVGESIDDPEVKKWVTLCRKRLTG